MNSKETTMRLRSKHLQWYPTHLCTFPSLLSYSLPHYLSDFWNHFVNNLLLPYSLQQVLHWRIQFILHGEGPKHRLCSYSVWDRKPSLMTLGKVISEPTSTCQKSLITSFQILKHHVRHSSLQLHSLCIYYGARNRAKMMSYVCRA